MTTRTTIRSKPAMALAGLFVAGTSFVLFNDLLEGARITTGHVLTALALIAATAAGHQIVTTWRSGRYGLTLGMANLATAALTYVATMSGARNAEQLAQKAERIGGNNQARAEILAERARALAMLDQARADIARECASGEGPRCKGRRATEAVYSAAVAGHDARVQQLAPAQTANAGYKAAAEALVLLPWFADSKPADVEKTLIVLLPWLAVLIAELGTIVFLSSALGHAQVSTVADDQAKAPSTPPDGGGKRRRNRIPASQRIPASRQPSNVIPIGNRNGIVSVLATAGRPMSVSELARAMGVCRGEASKRWREAGDLVEARREGKLVMIGLRQARAA